MDEENDKKKIQVKSFNHKWYGFIITYGILNIYFVLNINTVINNIYENFSKSFTSNVMIDGADFSIFSNLFAIPIFAFLVITNIGITLICEYVAILLFKFVYLKSTVKDEYRVRLYQYIKISLLCFIIANMIVIMFWGNIYRIIFYFFLYLPIPFFTSIFINSKIKRYTKEEKP